MNIVREVTYNNAHHPVGDCPWLSALDRKISPASLDMSRFGIDPRVRQNRLNLILIRDALREGEG